MYPNPLIYCTCWDPWNLGPRKLIKTPHPLPKTLTGKPRHTHPTPVSRERNYLLSQPTKPVVSPQDKAQAGKQEKGGRLPSVSRNGEVIEVSPGYKLIRNREQISVTLGDEMFNRKKHLESHILNKVKFSRTDIISDLEEQISELTAIIEQMNRDHQSAQKMLSSEMDLRCAEMKRKLENENRELKKAHKLELEKLENSYKEALKVEKASAQEKLEDMGKEYKYLKNMFHMYQSFWGFHSGPFPPHSHSDLLCSLSSAEHRITKKFELESEEEKRKMNESFSAVFENFTHEKELVKFSPKFSLRTILFLPFLHRPHFPWGQGVESPCSHPPHPDLCPTFLILLSTTTFAPRKTLRAMGRSQHHDWVAAPRRWASECSDITPTIGLRFRPGPTTAPGNR
ncbi:hypothetical protein U0070_015231 [Myodes glareolus]|uniref:Flagellum associated containing coiled-coil domains 1 n=1 Tax=Myodes glareolus TaxID=447135 RepID=A0AAW0JYC6_MYOGA